MNQGTAGDRIRIVGPGVSVTESARAFMVLPTLAGTDIMPSLKKLVVNGMALAVNGALALDMVSKINCVAPYSPKSVMDIPST